MFCCNIKKAFYFIVICFCVYSCNKAPRKQTINLNTVKVEDIKASAISFDEEPMFPKGCMLIDSLLILYESKLKDGTLFYTYTYPSDNYFYSLCWNSPKDKIREGKVLPEIHIFNWEGELQKILKPNRPISYFCVDEKNGAIYAVGLTSNLDFKIYKYDFNKVR